MASGIPAFSILVSHLRRHMQNSDIPFTLLNLSQIFAGDSRASIPQVFLAIGSTLHHTPKGRSARKKSESTVYQRCIQIKKSAFSDEAIASLEAGTLTVYMLRYWSY